MNVHTHDGPVPLRISTLTVTGLECADCADKLGKAVAALPGVSGAEVVFATARLKVAYRPRETSFDRILATVGNLGYGTKSERASTEGLRAEYLLQGLDCGDCAVQIEDRLMALPGIREARVNYGAATLEVVFSEGKRADIKAAVADLGYGATPRRARPAWGAWRTRRKIWSTIAASCLFVAGLVASLRAPDMGIGLFGLSVAAGGYYMTKAAILALRTSKGLDINFLMTVAVLGAAFLGKWQEAAEVVCLFAIGNALAASTMDRTRAALRRLLALAPQVAMVRENGKEIARAVEEVAVGSLIAIRPGERIPMDGAVEEGNSSVDESALTGESLPADKAVGSLVYAGSMNGRGAMAVRVTRTFEDSALTRIVHLVEEAQAQRSPIQLTVDRFSRIYTPVILVLAGLMALVPILLGWPDALTWAYQALALLVVSCPCALVISTPVAVASAVANASRRGLLIKGGAFLEALGSIDVMAFDKTGTLTRGRPEVTDFLVTNGHRPEELMAIAAALEQRSEHPLAEAILRKHHDLAHAHEADATAGHDDCCDGEEAAAHEACCDPHEPEARHAAHEHPSPADVEDFEALPGRGVAGLYRGKPFVVGNPAFMAERGVPTGEVMATLDRWRDAGKTPILIGEPGRLLGLMAIADAPRPEAREALAALRSAGLHHLVVLTGDHKAVAEPLGKALGADEVVADLLPDDKVKAVQALLARYGRVGMVGDGINDAPALATATVGVAMGVRGSDAALETADVILMQDDLRLLAPAVRLGKQAMAIIRQNIALAVGIKVVLLALAIPHVLTLGLAVIGDVGTTLLVILNGMRLLESRVMDRP